MSSISTILKASSAIGVFCGAAYFCLSKKSESIYPKIKDIFIQQSNVSNEISQNTKDIIEKLSIIDSLSKQICSEINLTAPAETLKKSLSSTLLDKLNTRNTNFRKNIEETLDNLSVRTKNEIFLGRFISLNGLPMLQDLILCCHTDACLTDEVNVKLSEVLANISQKQESLELIQNKHVNELLNAWVIDDNIVLNLNVVKVFSNISELRKHSTNHFTIYTPDIFLLDHQKSMSHIKDFDVVFINGMLGSVYYTWRQYDNDADLDNSKKTKCWPRDWLSVALPRARIIGINALLRPFVWNPMSNIDKINRAIEDRAVEIAAKLEMAEVGKRPILWVTHSAGGILLKHILHISQKKPLAQATRAILFMSTPHSGAKSMLGLYYFPFKYLLTPEAKHLETNSEILLQLNGWFKDFVKENDVDLLTLTETEPTKINKFYSTVIVPECDGEFDGHQQLRVKSNHLYISKPKDQTDEIYIAVLEFVKRTMGRRTSKKT